MRSIQTPLFTPETEWVMPEELKDLTGAKQIAIDLGVNSSLDSKEIESLNLNREYGFWKFSQNIYDSFKNADAILILTEWEEYSKINWNKASKSMKRPAWVFDARSIIDQAQLIKSDLNFWRIGDGAN